ncbi:uncharacterized protein A4U43_C08F28150 [Asparagus officinalis]|nr:uncharacterized protein A4U43_C08F28150 [Asparagus officinalis]
MITTIAPKVAASAPETVEATVMVEVAATETPEKSFAPSSEEAAALASASATTKVTEEKTEVADSGRVARK